MLLVTGEIVFGEDAQSFSGGTLYVRLEDVSLADAPSKLIAEQILTDISYEIGSETKLEFALKDELPDDSARYNVCAFIDLDGDRQVSQGDYISTQSYPVLTFGYPNHILVRVRKVE